MTIDTRQHMVDFPGVFHMVRRKSLMIIAGTLAAALYLVYVFVAFDVPELIAKSKPMRAMLLATDAIAHKVHVTKFLRGDTRTVVAVEGERTATYQTPPEWVRMSDDAVFVDLGGGYQVEIKDKQLVMEIPDYGSIRTAVTGKGVETHLPEGQSAPVWSCFF